MSKIKPTAGSLIDKPSRVTKDRITAPNHACTDDRCFTHALLKVQATCSRGMHNCEDL